MKTRPGSTRWMHVAAAVALLAGCGGNKHGAVADNGSDGAEVAGDQGADTAEPPDYTAEQAQIRGVPETEAWELPGLTDVVHVIRTEGNVPHIYASNRQDLALVQGFVIARDRYFMLDLARRLGLGEISSLLGDVALEDDVESRGIGRRNVAERILAGLGPEMAAHLDAFAAGVNAYIGRVEAGALPPPSELELAGPLLGSTDVSALMRPFDRRDLAGMMAVLMYDASFEGGDVKQARAAERVFEVFEGAELGELRRDGARDDVWPAVTPTMPVSSAAGFGLETGDPGDFVPGPVPDGWKPAARPGSSAARGPSRAMLDRLAARLQRLSLRLNRDAEAGFGSNAWAVSGRVSKDGRTLLAGDGHLSLAVPSLLYQIGLDTRIFGGGDFHQLGLSVPVFPIVAIGTNGDVAWSETQLMGDITDWYWEAITLDADGLPSATQFDDQQRPLVRVDETYEIADVPALSSVGRTETWPRWTTFDGRWLADIEGREATEDEVLAPGESLVNMQGTLIVPGDVDGDGYVTGISFDYAAFDTVDGAGATARFGFAHDVAEFRELSRGLLGYSQNFVAADAEGGIFYTAYQATPCRAYLDQDPEHGWAPGSDPSLLLDGTRYPAFEIPTTADGLIDEEAGADDPTRCVVPFSATPQSLNPARGYVLTANNDPGNIATDGSLTNDPWYIGGPWDSGFRADTIDRELAAAVADGDADVARMAGIQANHDSRLGALFVPWLLDAIRTARDLDVAAEEPTDPADLRLRDLYRAESERFDEVESRMMSWAVGRYQALSGVQTFYHAPAFGEGEDASATMLFNAWFPRFLDAVWGDEEIDDLFRRGNQGRVDLLARFLEARDAGTDGGLSSYNPETGESAFFDRLGTPEVEESRELMLSALSAALAWLASPPDASGSGAGGGGFGTDDMDSWLWGLKHQVRFESLLNDYLGADPAYAVLTDMFAIDTSVLPLASGMSSADPRKKLRWFPRPGDQWNVDAGNPGFSGTDFTYGDGPVMRMVIALGPGVVEGRNVIPGGQSALVDSDHFADQAVLWLGNEALPFRFHVADVVEGAIGHEIYRPEDLAE